MASGKDVRDILAIPQGQPSSSSSNGNRGVTNRANVGTSLHPNKKKKPKVDGISRELYALLGDNTPSLTFTQGGGIGSAGEGQESGRFMPKFKKRPQKTQRWTFAPFRNPARQDSLTLRHWLPEIEQEQIEQQYREKKEQGKMGNFELASGDTDDVPRIYRFSDQNTDSGVYRYSNDEYHQHLRDEDWTKEETDYLMDLCSAYDLRFVVITDRYEWPGKERSMEDLKARYYAICRRLIRSRISTDDMDARQQLVSTYSFDRAREVERKKHVARLFSRTPQQLAEEEALYVEARRLEQNEAKFAAEREELLRLLGGWERLPNVQSETVAAAGSGVGGGTPEEEASAEAAARKANRKRKAGPGELEEDGTTSKAGESASTPSGPLTAKQKAELRSKHFDEVQNIVRFDPQAAVTLANSKPPYPHLTGTPSTYPPVAQVSNNAIASHGAYLRSTRMLMPRSNLALKTQEALAELRPPISLRLTFPTQSNCEKWEGVVGAVTSGLEMKRQLDRVQSELRIAQMRSQTGSQPSQQPGSARTPSATPFNARRPSVAGRSVTPQVSISAAEGGTDTSAPVP